MRKLILHFFTLIFLTIISSYTAFAGAYPWIWIGKEDIQVISQPNLEAEFRLELIRRAQYSLDIITYDQRADEKVGMPLLKEVEAALSRGVRVRFASSWVAPLLKDPLWKSNRFLYGLEKKYPNFRFVSFGGPRIWNGGWAFLDGIHEKLLVVDKKVALVTGRGHADEYLGWLDTAFVFKGGLVHQSLDAFNRLWDALLRESGYGVQLTEAYSGLDGSSVEFNPLQKVEQFRFELPKLPLSRPEVQQFRYLRKWLEYPPSNSMDYRVRTLHHNFLEQMRQSGKPPKKMSYEERSQLLVDPVLEEAMRLIPNTQNFTLNTLAMILDPRLKNLLIPAIQNGMRTLIVTNGKEAHKSISPLGFNPGWYVGLKTMDELMQAGARVFGLKYRGNGTFNYVHRKLAIFDDTVIFGSHNFTLASTLVQDELSFELQGAEFARKMLNISIMGINSNTIELNPEQIREEAEKTPIMQWFSGFFDKVYFE